MGKLTFSSEKTTKHIRTAEELQKLECSNIILTLDATGCKVAGETGAAQLLGMNPATLSSRKKALGIKRPR